MHKNRNTIHYISECIDRFSSDSSVFGNGLIIAASQPGTTTCGNSLGGMLLCDLTVRTEQVTCSECLSAPRYPLDVLKNTEL